MVADIIPVMATPPGLGFFTYLVPEDTTLVVGQLVNIPFRKRTLLGVVLRVYATSNSDVAKLKPITKIITTTALISPITLQLIVETAKAYHASLGTLLKSTLPSLGPRALKKIAALPLIKNNIATTSLNEEEYSIIQSPEDYHKHFKNLSELGGQQLILVPDQQTLKAILPMYGHKKIYTINSNTKIKDFNLIWEKIRQGEPCLVVGTRRALFLPWTNLSHITVTEEGNSAYKSFDSAPRYQTEEVAARLSELTGAPITYYTHTPGVSRFTKYQADPPSMANVQLVNMKEERLAGNSSILSTALETELQNTSGHALLLLNRLGGITSLSCRDCDFVWRCPNCSRSLVLYQKQALLKCHFCSVEQKFFPSCPKCHGSNLKLFGAGTESLEKAILNRAWSKKFMVVRLDNATTLKTLPATSKPYLIIGTEFAFRYISPTVLSVAAVLDPDAALFVPEYMTAENAWLKLRFLRFWMPPQSKLFIQTRHHEHPIFQGLAVPGIFYKNELTARKLFKYPPFFSVLKLFKSGLNAKLTLEAATLHKALQSLTKELKIAILEPPKPAFPAVLKGQMRLIILAKFEGVVCSEDRAIVISKIPRSWKVDWNPESLLTI